MGLVFKIIGTAGFFGGIYSGTKLSAGFSLVPQGGFFLWPVGLILLSVVMIALGFLIKD